jgi:hypothetical protein
VSDVAEFFDEICLGHPQAREFCAVFHNWVHWIDDAVDRSRTYTVEETARLTLEAVFTFSENPFFQQHKEALIPLIIQAVLAWESSEEWALREDYQDFVASQVLKSHYHEVYWHVALIVGGLPHARKTIRSKRKFDYDLRTAAEPGKPGGERGLVHAPLRPAEEKQPGNNPAGPDPGLQVV